MLGMLMMALLMSGIKHKALVQHAVCLVQDEELKADVTSFCKVKESSRCRHQDIAASPQSKSLELDGT